MMHRSLRALVCCAAVLGGTARAQQPAPPPVRPLGPITAVAAESLASVASAIRVAGGRVYINDIIARRLLLLDSGLTSVTVVADTSGSREAYGASPGTLLSYRGDSALFISPSTLSMLVLTPEGTVARVMATPPAGRGMGLLGLIGNIFGTPGLDARGRLAYYAPANLTFQGSPPSGAMSLSPPDSAFVVRFDFAARTLDTVAAIRIPRTRTVLSRDATGRPTGVSITATPPATVDDWTVTSDGAIAVVRGRDYHVDWLGADGTWTATPRMAFAWERLDDAQKAALLDSMAAVMQVLMDSNAARQQRAMAGGAASPGAAAAAGQAAGASMVIVMRGEGVAGGGPGTRSISMPRPTVVKAELSDVPDYRPAFSQGAVRADADGRLWVRTSARVSGRPVYDVVNRQGTVVDRVQLPPYRAIAGFGPGVVYMGVRDSTGTTHFERASFR